MITEKLIKKVRNNLSKIRHLRDKYLVFSMGENCLTDDILSRNDLKSFSSPFSSGRSNIEYILAFEKEKYVDFLNPHYLTYETFGKVKVVRNKKYVSTQNHYSDACMNGIEFTHHDVISDTEKRKQIAKRCRRLQSISNKNVVFVYHNRYCRETDMNLLVSYFEEVKRIYEARNNHVQIFIFTQEIVSSKDDRKVECKETECAKIYTFYTQNIWEGENKDIFFAKCDDDLLRVMIDDIRENIKK